MSDASTSDATRETDLETDTDAPPLVAVYRHDVHKLRGRAHEHAEDHVAGVRVNEPVPLGADRDAALLSRPEGEPSQTVDAHASPRRLSLLTGDVQLDPPGSPAADDQAAVTAALVTPEGPEELHRRWLRSEFAARFNESVYYPYTSVKYHTLLAAALLDNYRADHDFADLFVTVTDEVVPHRTVLDTPQVTVTITADPSGPTARLGSVPRRAFADVWAQLPAHPLDTADRVWRILDAQLRRIRAGSAALQYVEDYAAAFAPGGKTDRQAMNRGGGRPGSGGD